MSLAPFQDRKMIFEVPSNPVFCDSKAKKLPLIYLIISNIIWTCVTERTLKKLLRKPVLPNRSFTFCPPKAAPYSLNWLDHVEIQYLPLELN